MTIEPTRADKTVRHWRELLEALLDYENAYYDVPAKVQTAPVVTAGVRLANAANRLAADLTLPLDGVHTNLYYVKASTYRKERIVVLQDPGA